MATFEKLKKKWASEKLARKRLSQSMRDAIIEKGQPVFRRFQIEKVFLFGSVLDSRSHEGSDIDILVSPLPRSAYWSFKHEMEETVGFTIDLHTQDDDPKFVRKVIERGEIIYAVQSGTAQG
jgi:predicted nucleotidyltransferase